MSKLNIALIAVIGILLTAVAVYAYQADAANKQRDEAASALFTAEAERDGLEVTLGNSVNSFGDLLQERDSVASALDLAIGRLEAAGARSAVVLDLGASAADTVVTEAVVTESPDSAGVSLPDSLHSQLQDGIADISVDCDIRSAACLWKYSFNITGRLLVTELANKSVVVTAEPDMEGVQFDIPSVTFVPSDPPRKPFWSNPFNIGCVGVGVAAGTLSYLSTPTIDSAAKTAIAGCAVVKLLDLVF